MVGQHNQFGGSLLKWNPSAYDSLVLKKFPQMCVCVSVVRGSSLPAKFITKDPETGKS